MILVKAGNPGNPTLRTSADPRQANVDAVSISVIHQSQAAELCHFPAVQKLLQGPVTVFKHSGLISASQLLHFTTFRRQK